jgi:hypothetical protein
MWFSYNVLGWTNTQIIEATTLEDAIANAFPEAYGFTQITRSEAMGIKNSWAND